MVPFLSRDLFKLVKSLMERFVKSALLKDVTSAAKLTSIDISKEDCFVDYSKVDIGFATENAGKAVTKNVSDKQLPRLPSVLQKLPKSSCCQAAEQDCRSVSTSKQSCIPGSLTYIRLRQEQDTSEVCIAPVSAV